MPGLDNKVLDAICEEEWPHPDNEVSSATIYERLQRGGVNATEAEVQQVLFQLFLKFSGSSDVASRNRLLRILATKTTTGRNFGDRSEKLQRYNNSSDGDPGHLATANFREFLFHALG